MTANTIIVNQQQSTISTVVTKPQQFTSQKIGTTTSTASLHNKQHLPENKSSSVFIPLCAKPSFLALLDQYPKLLEETINHTLATTNDRQDVLIFIADGAVMEEAFMAMDRPARAHRITSEVANQIQIHVNTALSKIDSPRIKGVVHWDELVTDYSKFQDALHSMESIMKKKEDESSEAEIEIQYHIKTLVKSLFTQRVEKARATGNNITNVFTGNGLETRTAGKYIKRYNHLERACLLELCIILVGLEYDNQLFTEMRYLTNDPQGMTFIAQCLEGLRKVFRQQSAAAAAVIDQVLYESTISHGIAFVKQQSTTAVPKITPSRRVSVAKAA